MAQVKLTIKDLEEVGQTYSLNFEIDESRVSDNQITAAHLVGAYIMNKMSSGELTREVDQFCIDRGIDIYEARPVDYATVVLTLIDIDLKAGTYRVDVDVQRSDDALYYTSGLAVFAYLMERLKTAEFLDEVWDYATKAVSERPGSSIINEAERAAHAPA